MGRISTRWMTGAERKVGEVGNRTQLAGHAGSAKENSNIISQSEQPPKYNRLSRAEFGKGTGALFLPLLLGYPHVVLVGNLKSY